MLVLLDLDNTLVDRQNAFSRWATATLSRFAEAEWDPSWLIEADRDGYAPRETVAAALRERLGLAEDIGTVIEQLRTGLLDQLEAFSGVTEQLQALGTAGARRVVVTNGSTEQQQRKLDRTGLRAVIDDVVVSEAVGCKKPDREIFRIALGRDPWSGDAWMVGDHPDADIRGARRAGLRTAWVSRGRRWVGEEGPELTADSACDLLATIRSISV